MLIYFVFLKLFIISSVRSAFDLGSAINFGVTSGCPCIVVAPIVELDLLITAYLGMFRLIYCSQTGKRIETCADIALMSWRKVSLIEC